MPFCAETCDTSVNASVDDWRAQRDPAKAGTARGRVAEVVRERWAFIPLWQEDVVVLVRQGLDSVKPSTDGTLSWLSEVESR
jgi:hypothetical protein